MKLIFFPFVKFLSYLCSIPIEQARTELSGNLDLSLSKGRWMLSTQKAIYSYQDLYYNFDYAFSKINWEQWQPQQILILGAGLGSIPFLLHEKYKVRARFTMVEKDEQIALWFEKYIKGSVTYHYEWKTEDAINYLFETNSQFDLIIIDVFIQDEVPHVFFQLDFLQRLQKRLSQDQGVLFNCMVDKRNKIDNFDRYYDQVFKQVFKNAGFFSIHKSRIIYHLPASAYV